MRLYSRAMKLGAVAAALAATGCATTDFAGFGSNGPRRGGNADTYDACILRHLEANPANSELVAQSCRRQFETDANILLASDQATVITDPRRTDKLMRISVTNPSTQIVTRVIVTLDFYDAPLSRNALGEVQQNKVDTITWTFLAALDPDESEVFTGTFGAKPPPNNNWVARAVGVRAMASSASEVGR